MTMKDNPSFEEEIVLNDHTPSRPPSPDPMFEKSKCL